MKTIFFTVKAENINKFIKKRTHSTVRSFFMSKRKKPSTDGFA